MQKNETGSLYYTTHKIDLKWIKELSVRPATVKHTEGNLRKRFLTLMLPIIFFIKYPKHG